MLFRNWDRNIKRYGSEITMDSKRDREIEDKAPFEMPFFLPFAGIYYRRRELRSSVASSNGIIYLNETPDGRLN